MKSMISGLRDHRAFSLVELLLYVGILGIVGGLLTGILTTATKTQVQQASQDKLSGELSFAMQTVQRLVQSSSLIDMDAGTTSSSLKLRTENLAQDPTLVYLSGGTIYIQQGSSTPQALTDGAVSVSSLQFQKFSQYPGKDIVQIDIAMNDANQPNALARSLRSAVSRASAATFDSPLLPGSNTYSIGTTGSPWSNGYFSGTLGIASGGLLGIGTLTPSYPLDLEVPDNGIFVSSTATTSNYALLNLQAGTTTAFYVRNDGNIGIGTSTPAYGLDIYDTFHVSSTATFDGNIVFGGATPTYRISNVATPATSTDVATKGYVDGLTAGGGIPSGYMILGSPTSTTPSGYTSAGSLLTGTSPFWQQKSSAPYTNYYAASTNGLDGNIYVIGGYWNGSVSSTMYAYNPLTDTWTRKASLPYTFYYGQAAAGPDGRIYAIGGYANGSPTSTVEAYTPSTDSWAPVASMPITFYMGAAATGPDGNIYVTGKSATTLYIYNTGTNTWSTGTALPSAAYQNTATLGPDGSIYVTLGSSGGNLYAYKNGTWIGKASLPAVTYGTNLVTSPDGNIYMFGGYSGGATSTVRIYNPGTNTWSTGTPLPYTDYYLSAAVGGDNLMYVIGGAANGSATSTTMQWDQSFYKLYTKN